MIKERSAEMLLRRYVETNDRGAVILQPGTGFESCFIYFSPAKQISQVKIDYEHFLPSHIL